MMCFSMKRVVFRMYSIILHNCTVLSSTSPRKPNQNLLKQNKYLLVHISEKPTCRATIRPDFISGSNVLHQCCPIERKCEPHASILHM